MKEFGETASIYEDVDVLEPDTETYQPDELPERQDELDRLHTMLRPVTMDATPRDVLIYGPTGQGKTVGVKLKTEQLEAWASENDINLTVCHVPCKGADSSYHVLRMLVKELREIRKGSPGESKPDGYQRKDLLEMVLDELKQIGGTVILILDEIDAIGEDDYVLYELPRADVGSVKLGVIGITNDLKFRNNLDADVRSSLGNRDITFHPYDGPQIQDILARRAAGALRDTHFTDDDETVENLESDVLEDGVIPLTAAFAARETGDAREAIRLLSHACDLADEHGDNCVTEDHVRSAHEELERDAIAEGISGETTQRKLALLTVLQAHIEDETPASTTSLYSRYTTFCEAIDVDSLVEHTFRLKLNDLSHGNLLDKDTTGRGRGAGTTNLYTLSVGPDVIVENLADDARLAEIITDHIEPLI